MNERETRAVELRRRIASLRFWAEDAAAVARRAEADGDGARVTAERASVARREAEVARLEAELAALERQAGDPGMTAAPRPVAGTGGIGAEALRKRGSMVAADESPATPAPRKKRRTRGCGELFKENGRWAVRWREHGRRRYKGGFDTRALAERHLAIQLGEATVIRLARET